MADNKLELYIKECFNRGYTVGTIQDNLIKHGYTQDQAEDAVLKFVRNMPPEEPPAAPDQTIKEFKIKLPSFKKEPKVFKCHKCGAVMISEDAMEFLKAEIKAFREEQLKNG